MAHETPQSVIGISLGAAQRHLFARIHNQFTYGLRCGGTPMWFGAPGIGKSALIVDTFVAACRAVNPDPALRILCHTVTLADREVTDVRGIAIPNRNPETQMFDRVTYTRSGCLPSPEDELSYDFILLFIDEVPAATLDHAKVIAATVYDYKAGDTVLDPGKYFVACAGNDVRHRAGAIRLPSHFINRVAAMFIEADVRPFLKWALTPAANIPPIARAYVQQFPSLFTDAVIPDEPNVPFVTVRSFTQGVQDLMATFGDPTRPASDPDAIAGAFGDDSRADATAILAAYIGGGNAVQFMNYAKMADQLTPLDAIVADPSKAPVPEAPDAAFAQALYLVSWLDAKNVDALMIYLSRMRRDLRVPTAQSMLDKDKSAVARSKEFTKFALENGGLIQTTAAALHR